MSIIQRKGSPAAIVLSVLGFFAFAGTASAGLISGLVNGNDCAGVFGANFEECEIDESPVIIKFEGEGFSVSEEDINDDFTTIDGMEWDFEGSGSLSGQFVYDPDDDEDPGIRFFAVKTGLNQFNLHYSVPEVPELAGCVGGATILSPTCVEAAEVLPTNTSIPWSTGTRMGISHITFYDTGGGDITRMPVPGTLTLLALGGLSLAVRRRKTR